ncbi:MAG: hypothetical protein Q7R83_01420 [bacterium]|nr:hypothetical protein [bacterium]
MRSSFGLFLVCYLLTACNEDLPIVLQPDAGAIDLQPRTWCRPHLLQEDHYADGYVGGFASSSSGVYLAMTRPTNDPYAANWQKAYEADGTVRTPKRDVPNTKYDIANINFLEPFHADFVLAGGMDTSESVWLQQFDDRAEPRTSFVSTPWWRAGTSDGDQFWVAGMEYTPQNTTVIKFGAIDLSTQKIDRQILGIYPHESSALGYATVSVHAMARAQSTTAIAINQYDEQTKIERLIVSLVSANGTKTDSEVARVPSDHGDTSLLMLRLFVRNEIFLAVWRNVLTEKTFAATVTPDGAKVETIQLPPHIQNVALIENGAMAAAWDNDNRYSLITLDQEWRTRLVTTFEMSGRPAESAWFTLVTNGQDRRRFALSATTIYPPPAYGVDFEQALYFFACEYVASPL